MKERPIIMGAESVRAILEGRKTQTRRVIKPRYRDDEFGFNVCSCTATGEQWVEKADDEGGGFENGRRLVKCPYGQVGDSLYVKERFAWWRGKEAVAYSDMNHKDIVGNQWYDEVNISDIAEGGKWKSPLFMPRWASRILLEITDIRVERVQEITPEDALKEGFCNYGTDVDTLGAFCEAWQKLNSKRGYPWESNRWVWVVTFKQVL